jgi:hypothetical protein
MVLDIESITTYIASPGLIIAHAEIEDDIYTVMSTDGGFEWVDIGLESSLFTVGDHGGLIVSVADKTLRYSWD